jgi:hypothetical protein
MAKSSTRKKSAKQVPTEVTQVINLAADYIKWWTDRELERLRTENKNPVCVPVKNGYRIGLYRLQVYPNKTCEVYDVNREMMHRFENKVSAIIYTIYTIKKQYRLADEILACDQEINKNYADMLSLRRSLEQAQRNKEYDIVDIRRSRLEIAQTKLEFARDKISKIHKHAKYNKVWE